MRFIRLHGRKEGEGAVAGGGSGVLLAGADGGAAVDSPEGAGRGSFDCGNDFCAGGEGGAGWSAGDQRRGGVYALAGGEGGCGDIGQTDAGFRFLLDFSEEAVELVNEEIAVGDWIEVVKGPLKGLEGELVKFRGTTKVAVRIDMLGCALVDIPASFVKTCGTCGS